MTSDHRPPASDGIEQGDSSNLPAQFMGMVMIAIAVAALYFGRPVLIPLALAILLAFALAPVVGFLRARLHFHRVVAVVTTLLFAVVIVGGLGAFIGTQIGELALELPRYQTNLTHKVQSVQGGAATNGIFSHLSRMIEKLGNQIQEPATQTTVRTTPSGATNPKPVLVEIHEPAPTAMQVVSNFAGPLLDALATIAIVLVFAAFLLLQKEDLRDRLIRLAGGGDLHRTTAALDDGATRLSRFLLAQTTVNAAFGIFVSIVLFIIGIPNPGLWGLIAAILRFVPYVGVPIAALFPTVLALAVDPGWSLAVWTLGVFLVTEAVVGQVIEPLVYSKSIGLSAVAVIVAATFWTWLWGPVGLLLSTPLTMCLLVVGRHVEGLRFLDVLLGDKPPLAVEESFYLRVLAGDADGAAAVAEGFAKGAAGNWHDDVALKALSLAQIDANRGRLDDERQQRILETIAGVIDNLTDREESAAAPATPAEKAAKPPPVEVAVTVADPEVLCVAARGPLDEAAGLLLADVLGKRGTRTRVAGLAHTAHPLEAGFDASGTRAVVVSYLEPSAYDSARYLLRRLSKRLPGAPAIVGFWCYTDHDTHFLDAVEATRTGNVVTNLAGALAKIETILNAEASTPVTEQAIPMTPAKPVTT